MSLTCVCVCVLLMGMLCVHSTLHHHHARVKDMDRGVIHYSIENKGHFIKLVKSSTGSVWVADQENLYSINTTTQVNWSQIEDECKENSKCEHTISVLREGLDNNPLLICRSTEENTKCYNLDSRYSLNDSFEFDYGFNIHEPSLLIGDMLYFTHANRGLFRINTKDSRDKIWPYHTVSEPKYMKLMASKDEKNVYSFFTEKPRSDSGDCESDLLIPRVSQICTNLMCFRMTEEDLKMFFSSAGRLGLAAVCTAGVEGERPFTHIIDVETVETHNDIKIYVLFRNFWNISAVCVYNASEISRVFRSSKFMEMKNMEAPTDHRPGQCVDDSTRLSADVLRFMKEGPEVKDLIMPETGPLMFQHHHYTHIKVHTINKTPVLYLALESGGVHKVLQDQPVFIIAEFCPFQQGTHITSMLLDTSDKRLYVSSGKKVIHIDLQMCQVYGDDCKACVLSRDPYCGWNGSQCAPVLQYSVQDQRFCDVPNAAPSKTEIESRVPVSIVPPSSRYYLLCPTISRHASYHWYHGNTRLECVQSHHGCFYFIESMNETYEGSYRCESTEGDYHRNISRYELRMNASPTLTANTSLLPCLLLLLTLLLS